MNRSGWGSALPRRLVLLAVAVLIPVLAGCEAGNNAPTLEFHYPTDAAGTVVDHLAIRNVFVLGAPLGSSLQRGQSASLFLAVINNGAPDTLTSISAPGTAASVALPAGGIPVRYQHPVLLTGPKPAVFLANLTRTVTGGSNITLVLNFRNAGPVVLVVPVMARAAHYVTYGTPPSASPTRHPLVQPTPNAAVGPTPSASPSR